MTVNVSDVKEKCFTIIDRFPEEQLENLFVSLEAMYNMLDIADDSFCLKLYRNSFDEDNNEPEAFEDFATSLGYVTK